ncbi:MAG: hypothetical protein CVT99_15320 [Bacteroidetes bacterium HGW-Bacteroidetes-16]|jgi:putative Mn2+ efflux pump MntP|nr:MAG: hypothetical protein CVT99_15320 [Bacteroidetes bacterium HGW-Bacteroidetes-16]
MQNGWRKSWNWFTFRINGASYSTLLVSLPEKFSNFAALFNRIKMQSAFIIAILFFLAMQPFPVAIGFRVKHHWLNVIPFILLMGLMQTGMFWAGLQLGNLFMHFMDDFKEVVIFLCFALVGIRMIMEAFQIRKGERTYSIDQATHVFFVSLAQAMNTLLVGLIFTYFVPFDLPLFIILFIFSTLFAATGVWLSPSKPNLSLASLLYLLGGLVMLIAAVYLAFFAA